MFEEPRPLQDQHRVVEAEVVVEEARGSKLVLLTSKDISYLVSTAGAIVLITEA